MTERPHLFNRPRFVGSIDDYEWLARWYGYDVTVLGGDDWKGLNTVLLVLSKHGEPLTIDEVREFREIVRVEFAIVGVRYTITSVG